MRGLSSYQARGRRPWNWWLPIRGATSLGSSSSSARSTHFPSFLEARSFWSSLGSSPLELDFWKKSREYSKKKGPHNSAEGPTRSSPVVAAENRRHNGRCRMLWKEAVVSGTITHFYKICRVSVLTSVTFEVGFAISYIGTDWFVAKIFDSLHDCFYTKFHIRRILLCNQNFTEVFHFHSRRYCFIH